MRGSGGGDDDGSGSRVILEGIHNLYASVALLVGAVTRDEVSYVTELRTTPDGWAAVGFLAVVGAIIWAVVLMYLREGRTGASRRVRLFLAFLRCCVMASLAVMLLEPVSVRILRRWIDSYTAVLIDTSSSMDLADTYRDQRTAERIKRVLETDAPDGIRRSDVVAKVLGRDARKFLSALADNNRVKIYTFSDEPALVGTIRSTREKPGTNSSQSNGSNDLLGVDDAVLDYTARGPATNIERAIRRSVDALGGAPIAAIVVFSDGGFNQGGSAEEAARFARDRKLPIHVVGIGDPSSPRNIRVAEVIAPPNAFQKDPFTVTAQLVAQGLDGETVHCVLREHVSGDDGTGRVVDTQRVRIGPGGSIDAVTFERRQDRVGRFVFTVEVPVLEGETLVDDNSKQVTVNVIDARTRVLLVSSVPSWEYRFVSRLLQRDETFDLSCWLQSADLNSVRDGNTIIDHLPVLAEELFDYDVVLLMDPSSEIGELDAEWATLLDTFVTEYGGGFLYTAARANTSMIMRDRTLKPLHRLLPVSLDPEADLLLNEIGHYQLSGSPVEITSIAVAHPVMRLANNSASSRLIWQALGSVYWHYPVLREKPAATVLMRHGDSRMQNAAGGHVLCAVQFVGSGRTGFLALDGTWRWRRQGVEYFDRFWVQLVRYLAEGKLLGGTRRGMIMTEGDQYSLGDAVTVTARLFDRQYKPLRRDRIMARFAVDQDSGEVTLLPRGDMPGWYEGRFVPDRTGNYRISISLPDPETGDIVETAREITVSRPNIEILRPQMDRAALVTLAERSYKGRYYEVDEAAELPKLIPDLHEEIPIRSRPTSLWDHWMVLTALLTLLTVEWGVRKWCRLL